MPRKSQLVCQHLENISREALEKHQDIVKEYVRGRQGIYALYRRGKLYYVGLATNLKSRLQQHLRDHHKQSWDRFSVYLTIGDQHMKEIESLLLKIANPSGNKVCGRFVKSENLRNKFMNRVRAKQRDELDALVGKPSRRKKTTRRKVAADGKHPLSGYLPSGTRIKTQYKGKRVTARVLADGRISFQSQTYTSPTAAARALTKYRVNGWAFWMYQRAPGDWVPLKELKK
ncbi:DUF2924 domain-containing protein [Candidatus Hydrogenedentota bacterium]